MDRLRRLALPLLALLALALPETARADLSCASVPEFARLFLRGHVQYNELDPEIEKRAIQNYTLRLDPSRTLLTQRDVEEIRTSLTGIFDDLQAGRCKRLTDLHKRMRNQHEAALQFVRKTVTRDDYEVDADASLMLDPEERGYPDGDAARDDLLLRMVHFQMSNYVGNDTSLADAKEKLVRRYDRRYRRFLEIPPEEIYADFLDAFASALDPHSNYLSAKVLEDFRIGMSLSLEGIGVALSEQDGYAVAERIIPGGAADQHGVLQPKDKLIAVAQEGEEWIDIIDMPLRDAVSLIRGSAGTKVGLTVLRKGSEGTKKFNIEIVRDQIDLAEQAAKLTFDERKVGDRSFKLAVLELPSFYGDSDPSKRQCTDDVKRLLGKVRSEKADGLLLDLSRNGGGLLQHAVTISGYFIRKGEVVGIEDARGRRQILADRDDGILYSGPMVVLISRVSASASEILAGALKDYGRAVIVGDDHTFGKGTVQTVSQLPGDNGALKITTALFYRPGGRSTQHSGVDAHVVLPSLLSGDDYGEKTQRFSLQPRETSPFLGNDANGDPGPGHWEPVRSDVISLLVERSRSRIDKSEEFAEIVEQLAEARESNGVVRVSELMERQRDSAAEGEALAEAAEEEDAMQRPQVSEALWILTDLVGLNEARAAAHPEARPES